MLNFLHLLSIALSETPNCLAILQVGNVMGSPSELGDSVIEVLDTLIKDPKNHYVYDDGFNI